MADGIDAGVNGAAWIIGVVLGLALIFGPVTALVLIVASAWHRLGITHRARALRVRLRRRKLPTVEHVVLPSHIDPPDVMHYSVEGETVTWRRKR